MRVFPLPFTAIPGGVDGLTSEQVLGIFSGALRDWSEVGGAPGKIRVVVREAGDSSMAVLRKSFPGWAEITVTARSKMATTTQEAIGVVADKARTIGFGPYPDALRGGVTVLKIDGRLPGDAGYPSFTTLGLVFKPDNRRGMVAGFVDFATGPAAHDIIREAGGVPVE